MRIIRAALLTVMVTVLAGCTSQVGGSASPAASTDAGSSPADEDGLIPAQYPACDHGAEILDYLATGDNGGDPGMDQVFADYVGVSEPKARALASDWIQTCNGKQADQEAAAASAAAEAAAQAASSASRAAASASQARHDAAVSAEQQRSCAAIGGVARDGICESASTGHVTGDPYYPCSALVVQFTENGAIDEASLRDTNADHPGCFH